jgi:hypothetical protein
MIRALTAGLSTYSRRVLLRVIHPTGDNVTVESRVPPSQMSWKNVLVIGNGWSRAMARHRHGDTAWTDTFPHRDAYGPWDSAFVARLKDKREGRR